MGVDLKAEAARVFCAVVSPGFTKTPSGTFGDQAPARVALPANPAFDSRSLVTCMISRTSNAMATQFDDLMRASGYRAGFNNVREHSCLASDSVPNPMLS